ncbi:MAG: M48 family metallopeptidase [Pseudomonadota bacterium]
MSRRRTTLSKRRARRPCRQVKRLVEGQVLTLDDRRIPLIYQRNSRARRIILRFDQSDGRIVVVLPPRATYDEGRRFAQAHRAWIRERIELLPEGVPFAPGKTVPFLGQPHRIRHRPKARGVVWCEEGEIHVAGRPEHLSRRVEDWLKLEARREIAELAHEKAARIGKRVRRVRLRDPKTRWASCSASAELAFSWRLVLAPKWVLDYVVAHEVAHLREMNHEPRFWRLVDELTPYARKARAWLAEHGPDLHRYGRSEGERAPVDPLPL